MPLYNAPDDTGSAGQPDNTVSSIQGVSGGYPVAVTGSVNIGTGSVSLVDGTKATYSAAITGFSPTASPTDIFTITGGIGKIVRVTRIALTATQSTSSQRDVLIIKRSTANIGGLSATLTAVPHDATLPGALALVRNYITNPTTLGTSVGVIRSRKVFIGSTTANSDEFITDFGTRNCMAIVLRGTSETLAINLNGVTSSSSLFDISIEWTEE